MNYDHIIMSGIRTHNLKNINLKIPRNKLVVLTGLSGSGKSSLAFDTLYAEGQRRYVESLSTYARQFLNLMDKPDVDSIEGLSPAISIEQKSISYNPRSTVGTITEIYDYFRLLYARIGIPKCPEHKKSLKAQTHEEILDTVLSLPKHNKYMLLSPIIQSRKGEYQKLFLDLQRQGFIRIRIDGDVLNLDQSINLDKNKKHSIDVVVDRFIIESTNKIRLSESISTSLKLSDGIVIVSPIDNNSDNSKKNDILFSNRYACPICNYSIGILEPKMFSFNNPAGSCSDCDGLGMQESFSTDLIVSNDKISISEGAIKYWGPQQQYYFQLISAFAKEKKIDIEKPFSKLTEKEKALLLYGSEDKFYFLYKNEFNETYKKKISFEGVISNFIRRYRETESESVRSSLRKLMSIQTCSSCQGSRLNKSSRNVYVQNITIPELNGLNIEKLLNHFSNLELEGSDIEIAKPILNEINQRLRFLHEVGLSYLTIGRTASTLSGGESQRIRLASQIGSGLVGVMYILDEPSIGLHQRDNDKLLSSLKRLRDLGNTLIIIEHDEDTIRQADYIIDIGPGAGLYGGEIVASGTMKEILSNNNKNSYTVKYLLNELKINIPTKREKGNKNKIKLSKAQGNNLKSIDIEIPLGCFIAVTGVSGSGKSTLINRTLYPALVNKINKSSTMHSAPFKSLEGYEHIDKVIDIDQSPIGRTPRSNPATYTGVFTPIRDLFANLPESRARGYKPGRFTFNLKGGRCEKCEGDGIIKVEMHFMSDIYISCEICKGKRYNEETLQVKYKNKSIHDILSMSANEALAFFENIPSIKTKIKTIVDVGLGYITLGHSATHLSGGEAQRIKLSKELSKKSTGKTLYILDEPTTGLHFHDIAQLLKILLHLRDQGNTIVVIEHNLEVIKTADWIIDLGPEGGDYGGEVIAYGTPEKISTNKNSFTGKYLKDILSTNKLYDNHGIIIGNSLL